VAVLTLLSESKRSRFSLGIDLLLKLEERFEGQEMLRIRRKAARSLLKKSGDGIDDVLNFFKTIGLLVRKGALDGKMVWHSFSYWIHRYWLTTNEYIKEER